MQITKKLIVASAGIAVLIGGGGTAYAATASGVTASAAARISAKQAVAIARKAVPGARVREVDFERRGRRADVWEVELIKGTVEHEIYVNATSGKIVKHETDRDDRHGGHGHDD